MRLHWQFSWRHLRSYFLWITLGNRQAAQFIASDGVSEQQLAEAAHLASFADETAEGRSIAVLAKNRFGLRGVDLEEINPTFIPFLARTRMSGVSFGEHEIRMGATDAIETFVRDLGGFLPDSVRSVEMPGGLNCWNLAVASISMSYTANPIKARDWTLFRPKLREPTGFAM